MKNIAKIIIPLAAVAVATMLPFPFMFMGPLIDGVAKTLKVEVDPRYSGGEVLAKFLDPMDDDRGEGSLIYPDLPAFQGKRVLDIVKYTVRRPVLNVRGGDALDFWQLDVTFAETANPLNAPLGFSLPVVHIYIDVDGTEGGSIRTANPDAELVSFDPAHPWDYMIHVDGFAGDKKGRIVSFDGTYQRPVEVFFVAETKTIHARVELDHPSLKRILDGRPTYHYVMVGAFDPLAAGGFMPVAEKAGPRNGGGASSALTPRIYDWTQPEGVDQPRTLLSHDQRTGGYAVLVPLEAKESPKKRDSSGEESARRAAELLATYRAKLAREQEAAPRPDVAAEVERLVKQGAGGMELVEAYYRARMFDEAAEASRRILESEPGHAGAATYLAMATAGQSGEQKSPLKSLEFVNRAIALFENALPLCKTPGELLTFYLQRGRYFAALPESLFRRSAAAAEDLLKAAAIIKQQEDSPGRSILLAGCYIDAARALAQAGNADEAEIYFKRAAEFKDLTTGQIVTLLGHSVVPAALRRQE